VPSNEFASRAGAIILELKMVGWADVEKASNLRKSAKTAVD
jgi:hypothetical protein